MPAVDKDVCILQAHNAQCRVGRTASRWKHSNRRRHTDTSDTQLLSTALSTAPAK